MRHLFWRVADGLAVERVPHRSGERVRTFGHKIAAAISGPHQVLVRHDLNSRQPRAQCRSVVRSLGNLSSMQKCYIEFDQGYAVLLGVIVDEPVVSI